MFSDLGIRGTSTNRPGFQQLVAAARNGQIDMILCKSISRLARNAVDLLDTIPELKTLGGRYGSNMNTSTPPPLMGNSYSRCWRRSPKKNPVPCPRT